MRLPASLLSLALAILPTTLAVFADDAYHTDYHHELLGLPQPHTTFFHRPRKEEKANLLYTLSDLGVIGAVNPANGQVVWRKSLAAQNRTGTTFLRPVEGDDMVVSAVGCRVDSWDALSGRQRWGNVFEGVLKDLEVVEAVPGGPETRDALALFEENRHAVLRRLDGDTGDVVWEYRDNTDDVPLQTSTNIKDIFVVALHQTGSGYNLKVTTLDTVTGRRVNEYTLSSKGDVHGPEDVLLVGANSASPIIAWADNTLKFLKVNILGKTGDVQSLSLKDSDGQIIRVALHAPHLIQSLPHFLVHSFSKISNRADVYHINLATGSIAHAYELPKVPGSGAISTSSHEANVYFTRITEDEVIIVSSSSHGVVSRWPVIVNKNHGDFIHGVSEVIQKPGNMYASRSAVLTTDEDWVLVRNGAEAWSRAEGLSNVVSAAWAEIPEAATLAKTLEAEADRSPLLAYAHRLKRHLHDLQHLPAYVQALPTRLLGLVTAAEASSRTPVSLVRDSFGFNKIVIVSTARGRVYGLDAGSHGAIIWNSKVFDISGIQEWKVRGIWVNNTDAVATIKGATGETVTVNTTTGAIIQKTNRGTLDIIERVVLVNSVGGKKFLTIGPQGDLVEIPSDWPSDKVLVVRGNNDEVRGLRIEMQGVKSVAVALWTFNPGPEYKIVGITTRSSHDPVASIGRVLGDRTVLYKYLNPNVVLVTAVSQKASIASFHLLDSVSGVILHSTNHAGIDARQPITAVLTENWYAYSLWGDLLTTGTGLPGSKGYQIIISELFESDIPNYRPLASARNSSSLKPSDIPNEEYAIPYVATQAFLISQPISHMAVTQTRQGISTRQLLCVIPSENSIYGIPRTILDPRRPVGRDPNPMEAEEGLFRYVPFIQVDPKLVLSHSREVFGVKNIITTPAVLESTSLVFAYGIDIFGTRVAPSAAFDVLGKGFNKPSLVATVLGLGVGVAVLAPMVRRKQINGRWIAV